jgi:hypothetical protein
MSNVGHATSRDGPGGLPCPPEHPRRWHEPSDVNVRAIVLAAVALVVVAAIIHVALYFQQRYYNVTAQKQAVPWNPLAARQNELPLNARLEQVPTPRLEGLVEFSAQPPYYRSSLPVEGPPTFHPEDLRPERQPQLQKYGWVDREKGIAHIPIDRAMRAALEMNLLPARQGATRSGQSGPPGGNP